MNVRKWRHCRGGIGFSTGIALLALAVGCSEQTPAPDAGPGSDGNVAGQEAGVGREAGAGVESGASGADGGGSPGGAISEAELRRVTATLAADEMDGRDEGTPGSTLARNFIIAELKACGVKPGGAAGSFEQKVTTGAGTNILGLIEGSGSAEERARTIVLSAHYDHLGHGGGEIYNGADDNAAAVAIVLRVACALAKAPPKRTVLIASWDSEEPPTFLSDAMGSAFWVANPTIPLDRVDTAIALDLAGSDLWPGFEGHFLLGSELSPEVSTALQAAEKPQGLLAYRASLHLVEESALGHQAWSDYDAFRNNQVPVLFLTNGQNGRYHTVSDEMAGLNLPKMTQEAIYLHRIVEQLAGVAGAAAPKFQANGVDYLQDAEVIAEVLAAALEPTGLVSGVGAASKKSLEEDLAAVQDTKARLSQGVPATQADVKTLRRATQRVMCLAGSTYQEVLCNLF